MSVKIYLEQNRIRNQTDMFIFIDNADGTRHVVKPMQMHFVPHEEGTGVEPSLSWSGANGMRFLPAVVDALAECGYRHESKDNLKQIEAMKAHIADLQKIVFKEESFQEKLGKA